MSLIFMAGIHGVGKSFLGSKISKSLGISHFTASQLIYEEMGRLSWNNQKKTDDLNANQMALIRAIEHKRLNNQNLLIDGHFVLHDSSGALIPVGQNIFELMRLSGVILLTDDAITIQDRIKIRDGVKKEIEEISKMADAEYHHAQTICQKIKLPLLVLNKPTETSASQAVSKLLNTPMIKV